MRYIVLLVVFVVFLNTCEKKTKLNSPITEIEFLNNAEYYYGGLELFSLEDKKEVEYLIERVHELKDDKSNEVMISVNYGYVDVISFDENHNSEKYFSVVFTEFYGDVIRYNGKHYYYDEELVGFIKDKLKMWKLRRPD